MNEKWGKGINGKLFNMDGIYVLCIWSAVGDQLKCMWENGSAMKKC